MFSSINKAPRNTAASTTFTVSGQKITIIGHARCGKTSLKNALFGRDFEEMTFPTVTAPPKPAVVVRKINILDHGDDGKLNGDEDTAPDLEVDVEYEIYDTPGQKVLEYIPPLYITGSFCVFIVYDITDSFSYQRAMYWVHYLEDHAKGYDNVVLIGNKFDLGEGRCLDSDAVQQYADEHGIFFIEISVKTKHNFDVLLSWLESKTQEKMHRHIAMEEIMEEEGQRKEEQWEQQEELRKRAQSKHSNKDRRKSLLRRHAKRGQTIQLDEVEIDREGEKHRAKRACCSF